MEYIQGLIIQYYAHRLLKNPTIINILDAVEKCVYSIEERIMKRVCDEINKYNINKKNIMEDIDLEYPDTCFK